MFVHILQRELLEKWRTFVAGFAFILFYNSHISDRIIIAAQQPRQEYIEGAYPGQIHALFLSPRK